MKYAALAIMTVILAACSSQADLDKVMGRVAENTPTQEQRIDCDLIFPGPDHGRR